MSLKSYLDPVKAFDKWIIANPKGGIFVWKGIKLEVKEINRVQMHNLKKS
jgi:hypothetical protein